MRTYACENRSISKQGDFKFMADAKDTKKQN